MPKAKRLAGGGDTAAGDILWLNPWPSGSPEPMHKIFNHPVMIVSVDRSQQAACVLIISSLNGKNLANYGIRSVRAVHLPIDPSPAHPDTGELLFLKRNLQLQKHSYIKTKTRYWVSTSLIRFGYHDLESGKRYQLRTGSLARVLETVDADVPIKDGMASKEMHFGILNSNFADQALPLVPESVPDYGSTHQLLSHSHYAAQPPSKTWPKAPLPSIKPVQYPTNYITTDYGSTHQSLSNSHYAAQPPSKTSPKAPLPSIKPVQYPTNYITTDVHRPANPVRQYARNQQCTTMATSPLLPVYAQPRAHRSRWSASLGAYVLVLLATMLLGFFIYKAYWIHGLEGGL